MTGPLIEVRTTVATEADAQRIADALVTRRLAACVQVEAVRSTYVWQGALQHDSEWRLLAKTLAARWPELEAAIRELHPYALPAIWATPVVLAGADYAAWVEAGCSR
ncbi:divalent-cation tolerance protein CutA [Rubrivivax benzoatilyticus]|uniref:Divalent-cation tolerance protein CutA n=1 Tax=Rubrivivax benzoatilyticus TaxID=316997 RepID=A0ABX0HQL9_9BURK|nr:divalent-cation tolerance protein CutA [Rubrivivax benzoatilyticus]EGJ08852.1 CutA1 divalent ion tolerance protein [Rubrivivax benzoatilyticus JA2 = ATCC BAA-35]NHK97364.1 divalent-cation tolerance protein CutA [Rubrivivax benzoatilyticus]NHL22941.1 divalent-cation tolerance protein CutA [Rubrivivax benzoatilyticus]